MKTTKHPDKTFRKVTDIFVKNGMKYKLLLTIMLVMLFPTSAKSVIVSIAPSTQVVSEGEKFTVEVVIDPEGANVNAVGQIDLQFDPNILAANSVTEGDFFKEEEKVTFFNPGVIDNDAGSIINMSGTKPGGYSATPGIFVNISFTAEAQGTSFLDFHNILIYLFDASIITPTVNNGSVTVSTPATVVPTPTMVVSTPAKPPAFSVGSQSVSPNPYVKGKTGVARITFDYLPQEATIKIYTVFGKLLKTIKHKDTAAGGSENWDISDIPGGIYIYTIESALGHKSGKVTIIK